MPGRGHENNIKIDLNDIGWEDMCWIQLAQDSDKCRVVVCFVMNLPVQ